MSSIVLTKQMSKRWTVTVLDTCPWTLPSCLLVRETVSPLFHAEAGDGAVLQTS